MTLARASAAVAPTARVDELEFMRHVMLAVGSGHDLRLWRQNCGKIPVRDRAGKVLRVFDAGPPAGAADLSGFVIPEGWRLEVECKGSRGKRTKEQERWARNVAAAGCVYVLVEYDAGEALARNVRRAVDVIIAAIAARRAA